MVLLSKWCARILCAASLSIPVFSAPAQASPSAKLYTIDCGTLEIPDLGPFSDRGYFDGKSGTMPVPCFLIDHPQGLMLWDAGLDDRIRFFPWGFKAGPYWLHVERGLINRLEDIGVSPSDVKYLAFSHFHFDHTGNAAAFERATWIVPKIEVDWATHGPVPAGVYERPLKHVDQIRRIDPGEQLDVFGDGAVRIVATPGHSPGHSSLILNLEHSGKVILVGDLYHSHAARDHRLVPAYNTDREQTLHSMDKLEALAKKEQARMVIGHSWEDFRSMPAYPAFLN